MVVVFAYDFPHKKTQDVLIRLFLDDIPVSHVLAAPKVDLPPGPGRMRKGIRHGALVHPRHVANQIGAEYQVVAHSGPEITALLDRITPDLGLVAGARLLPPSVVDAFSTGIINLHPGLIPEARGLDALLWSIRKDLPPGVTSHLIDAHVDAGFILLKETLAVHADDTILDISERINDAQLDQIAPAVEAARAGDGAPMPADAPPHKTRMSAEMEMETMQQFEMWKQRHEGEGQRLSPDAALLEARHP